MKNFFKNRIYCGGAGFTLIDLLTSVIITVIIFSFVLANISGRQNRNLDLAVQKIASDIREAQTMGQAGKIFTGLSPAVYPTGGYGVYFQLCPTLVCQYELFADLNFNVYPDVGAQEVSANFFRPMLSGNQVEKICFSTAVQPALPPFEKQNNFYNCASGWSDAPNNFAAVIFRPDVTLVRLTDPTRDLDNAAEFVSLLLYNETSKSRAYIYLTRKTNFVGSGLIQ